MNIVDIPPMQLALQDAEIAAKLEEVPVGAVIVRIADGEILARAHNQVESLKDPTAHAEILAIRAACLKTDNKFLSGCAIYVTLEPCAMCAQALANSRISRIYYAAADEKGGAVENGARIFSQATCHHKPEIYAGICENESKKMLQSFFKNKRL